MKFTAQSAAILAIAGLISTGLLISAPVFPAWAQQTQAEATPAEGEPNAQTASKSPQTPKLRVLPPAYETQMLQLSKALGSLHYLRAVCKTGEGQTWREAMEKLLEAEQPDEQRRARMIAHFNRGFRGYAEIHFECNDAAVEAANRFLAQATRITAEIPNRYGR